jgi:hypothetical protein
MTEITLHFPSTVAMIDFPVALIRRVTNYDLSILNMTGFFSEADIHLAKAGFNAEVLASPDFKDMNANR